MSFRAAALWVLASMVGGLCACGSDGDSASNDEPQAKAGSSGKGSGGKGGAGGSSAGGQGGGAGSSAGGAAGSAGSAGSISFSGQGGAGGQATCSPACAAGSVCIKGICAPEQPACTGNDQCKYDTHCVDGQCAPWDTGETDSNCKLAIAPEVLAPEVKCEFTEPAADDPFPQHRQVYSTPMVAPLGGESPSIVAAFAGALPSGVSCSFEDCNYRFGILRVLSGRTCAIEANLGGSDLDGDGRLDWVRSSSPPALADLDGDKLPEIVVFMADYDPAANSGAESLVAFTRKDGSWKPLWPKAKATRSDGSVFDAALPVSLEKGSSWAGPSIHDLDDDGVPDIVREGYVVDGKTGVLKAEPPAGYTTYWTGVSPVIAPLDDDPRVEMTNGAAVWEYDPASGWVADAAWAPTDSPTLGWSAVADFDPGDGTHTPEIVTTYGYGSLAIRRRTGEVFANVVVTMPGGGSSPGGGPPTVADFDGDGLPEVGTATGDFYVVIDPDCQATPRPGGKCESRDQCQHMPDNKCPDLFLWTRRSQDHSSRQTGSSVFDFEGDGSAEVVYADECFVRVYSGKDGKVLFSQYRSSSTWQENPVIADTDGDFRADLVVGSNGDFPSSSCAELLDPSGVETHFAGSICEKDADCPSGTCSEGLCRCTASAQCCGGGLTDDQCVEQGLKCAPAAAGTAGTGDVCRASYPHGRHGIRVYQDSRDRWVRSRTIWNQHAYAVTNVDDDGSVPKTSAWKRNWEQPTLNNFRQNVPGEAATDLIPDLTAQLGQKPKCTLTSSALATLEATICNRGTAPVGTNLVVGFYSGQTLICQGTIKDPIEPGQCATASCQWPNPPSTPQGAVDIRVVPNDGQQKQECLLGNNEGLLPKVWCFEGAG